jgi:hypothetical protein
MKEQFNTIMRSGKQLDMYREIEDLQAKYYEDMQSSVSSFEFYDEVVTETYNDYMIVKNTLNLFAKLGYLYKDEAEDMIQSAWEQRLSVLEGLTNEKSGS